MPAPTSYTESGLSLFMRAELSDVAKALNWATQVDFQPAIDETLLGFGTDNIQAISGMDNIKLLRAFARVHAWRLAAQTTAGDYNFSADGGNYSRAQVHEQCLKMLERAEAALAQLADGHSVIVEERTRTDDPYALLVRWAVHRAVHRDEWA